MTVTRLARAAAIVAVFGLISRLLGFAREIVLAAAFGASGTTDAYVNSLLIVNAVAALLLYTLVTLIIPTFQRERAEAGADSAWRLVSALAVWVGIILIVLSTAVAIWPEVPAALFHLDPTRAAETATLIRIMAPAIALQGFSAIFTAMLQIHGRFAGPAAVGVAFNAGIILGVVVGQASIGIKAAAWGVVVGALLQVVLQLPQFLRLLRDDHVRPAVTHPRLGALGLLAVPVVAASLLQQINSFTDKLFASSLEAGRVSALNFANALGQAPRVALLLPLMTPLFPLIAKLVGEQRDTEAIRAFRRVAGLLGLVSVPMTVLLAVYAHEVTQVAFGRGRCTASCVDQISGPLLWYALGLWASFASYLTNRTLAAARRQSFILWTTIMTVAVTIVLDLILLGPMEQSGLALAATIGVYASVAMSMWGLRDEFPNLPLRNLGDRQARVMVAGVGCAVTALALDPLLPTGDLHSLALVPPLTVKVIASLAVYYVLARALARPELDDGLRSVRALVGRGGAR